MSEIMCVFCRGRSCKYENYERWLHTRNTHNAIEGVWSNWITDDVLAMARPSARSMREHGITGQFRAAGIGAVFNLQQPGEHPRCGDGIVSPEGFSYDPEEFAEAGIAFHNTGWRDMGCPTCEAMLDIVQLVAGSIARSGKVAIHCHAGLGRTGLVAASFLIFEHRLSPDDAIAHVRLRRPGSVQNRRQEQFLHEFARFVQELGTVFPAQSVDDLLRKQRRLLHGEEYRALHDVPKIVSVLCSLIPQILGDAEPIPRLAARGFSPSRHAIAISSPDSIQRQQQQQDREFIQKLTELQQFANSRMWEPLASTTDAHLLLCCLAEWLAGLQQPLIPESSTFSLSPQRAVEEVLREKLPSGSFSVVSRVAVLLNDRRADDQTFRQFCVLLSPPLLSDRLAQEEVVKRLRSWGQFLVTVPSVAASSTPPETIGC